MNKLKLIDLHSDILTSKMDVEQVIEIIKNNNKLGYRSVNAIYKGNMNFKDAKKIAKLSKKNQINYIAYENCCYEDFINEQGKGESFLSSGLFTLSQEIILTKPKYVSLTWNNDNLFAGGARGNSLLTGYGKLFISEMNRAHIPVDLAHLNKQSFYDVIKRAEKVLCSHTAIYNITPHKRNIDYLMISEILKRNGIVGITFVGYFLSDNPHSVKECESGFYRHIDGYLQNFGTEGLCIGSDFYGTDASAFENGNYQNFLNRFVTFMIRSGAKNEDIEKILYKNALNFFKSR